MKKYMTKENFIKSMNIIIDTFEGIDEVYKDTKDVLDLSKIDFIKDLIYSYIDTIKDEFDGDYYNCIEYYLFECNLGKNIPENKTSSKGKDYLSSLSNFYDFLKELYK